MSSPPLLAFSQFIKIDRRKSDPVYLQIVYQFIQAVQLRMLEDGDQLPGSRPLSRELKIHRKTLVKALEELQLQGWIRSVPSVGRYVINPELQHSKGGTATTFPRKATFPFHRSFILDRPHENVVAPLRFTDGTPDYRLIPSREIGRFYSSVLKRRSRHRQKNITSDHSFFKKQLSFYLNTTQGFHLSTQNLLTTPSKSVLLYVIAQLCIQPGDQVLVSTYSHPVANMVFQQAGAQLQTIPMDTEGLLTDFIRKHFKKGEIKLLYYQPQHHYPTTICLAEKRRQELLQLSRELNFILIEDDRFSELTYEKSLPLPFIKRKHKDPLLYIGSFGHYLQRGFQTHFLLGPEDFIAEAEKYLSLFSTADPIKKRALGEMIYEGDIHRYRRKSIQTYIGRRNLFTHLLQEHFPNTFDYQIPAGGLAFWLAVKPAISLSVLSKKCEEKGLLIPRACRYQIREEAHLRLGFGHFNEKELQEAITILRSVFEKKE